MKLNTPLEISPEFMLPNGTLLRFPTQYVSDLNVVLIDNAAERLCEATVQGGRSTVVLWEDDAYDAAGDYTQAQAEARLLEVLGPDLKAGLEGLFLPSARPNR